MKERLIQLLDLEQLSPSRFADIIGVQRSSISHIMSGRNKPSYDFLQKTLKAFPGLNASWLLMGEGPMYEQMGRKESGSLFDAETPDEVLSEERISESGGPPAGISAPDEQETLLSAQQSLIETPVNQEIKEDLKQEESESEQEIPTKKRITQIMIIYDDDTFKTFMPAN